MSKACETEEDYGTPVAKASMFLEKRLGVHRSLSSFNDYVNHINVLALWDEAIADAQSDQLR